MLIAMRGRWFVGRVMAISMAGRVVYVSHKYQLCDADGWKGAGMQSGQVLIILGKLCRITRSGGIPPLF